MAVNTDKKIIEERIHDASVLLQKVRDEMAKRIIGQHNIVTGMLIGIVARGHILLEGVPGLAKTLIIRTMSEIIDAEFKRIQFTPDLLPADIIGTMIYRPETGEFVPRKGPIFANIVLADEVNRAPAKVQSAMLETMEERQVTLGDMTHALPEPFFVLATQNPIEQEGTYPLPEAQLDRFMLKLFIEYPSKEEELSIIELMGTEKKIPVQTILQNAKLDEIAALSAEIQVDRRIKQYIVSLVAATRPPYPNLGAFARFIEFGASPRASIYLYRCAKVHAMLFNRSYVLPDDVKAVAPAILRHRITLSYEAEADNMSSDDVLTKLLSLVAVP